ncbi:uncharacterized transmembrane protein DDB_G0289901-like [Neocloeon triangulifer]|uniref:uncharacterized transmembrane protein DDB_G0289901-like n=1 Tax=Neocloeon triangulifer TaxID=2078957 RepID=UPI00286EFA4D|nr:uncharacterized transmembrane protein DDB_G0289901-like [Neocloeon triangulifer]
MTRILRCAAIAGFLFTTLIILSEASSAKKNIVIKASFLGLKSKSSTVFRRAKLIKCCGKNSCISGLPVHRKNESGSTMMAPDAGKNGGSNGGGQPAKDGGAVTSSSQGGQGGPAPESSTDGNLGVSEIPAGATGGSGNNQVVDATTSGGLGYTGITAGVDGDYGSVGSAGGGANLNPGPGANGDPLANAANPGSGAIVDPNLNPAGSGANNPNPAPATIVDPNNPIADPGLSGSGSVSGTNSPSAGSSDPSQNVASETPAPANSVAGGNVAGDSVTTTVASGQTGGASSNGETTSIPAGVTNPKADTTTIALPAGGSSTAKNTVGSTNNPLSNSSTVAANNTGNSATVLPKSNPCMDDVCVLPCDKDPTLFVNNVLQVPAGKGAIKTICGKDYFVSTEKANYTVASKACCSMGMFLSSFETRAEQDCFSKYNKDVLKLKKSDFWIGATDMACYQKFTWCTGSQIDISKYDWTLMQPNYLGGNQHCIVMTVELDGFILPGDNGLNDWECYELNNYLCEKS